MFCNLFFYFCTLSELSSVGLERFLDREEVTGSNPVVPTNYLSLITRLPFSFV